MVTCDDGRFWPARVFASVRLFDHLLDDVLADGSHVFGGGELA